MHTMFHAPARRVLRLAVAICASLALTAFAADYPAPKEAQWIAKDFKFHTGQVMPELRINYATIGDPKGEPVLMLHGTTGSWNSVMGQDSRASCSARASRWTRRKWFVIVPDRVGLGKSTKPTDGLRAGFPKYSYVDMVDPSIPAGEGRAGH